MKVFVVLSFFIPILIFSQVTNEGKPISWKVENENIKKINLPEFNLKQIQAEDKENDGKGDAPWRFGYEHQVDMGLNTHGQWTNLADGSRYWLLNIKSDGAKTMNFIFDEFYLPEGAKLYFYNADHSDVLGAYTHSQNREDKIFGSWLVDGDDIFIEYYEPFDKIGQGKLHLSRAVHGYRSVSDFAKQAKALNQSGDCNLDVDCSIGADFDDLKDELKKSVALLISGGSSFCTGALINNTNNDGTPYFLTANHCVGGSVGNWAFRFNWRSPNPQCATTNNSTNGTFNQTISGATLKASNSKSDFALVEITAPVPNSWDLVWAGWNRSETRPDYAIGIHHPSGDIMKVCRDDDGPTLDSRTFNFFPATQMWLIGNWEEGVTEPGSSGSPLFNQNGEIIGQLAGGSAACLSGSNSTSNNGGVDYYGRLSTSWDFGSSSSRRLKDWLDPNNTGAMTLGQYPTLEVFDVDAKLLVTNTFDEVCRDIDVQPLFIIENIGNNPITSIELTYQMNDENEVNLTWTGNLLNGESETIATPILAISEGLNNLTASLSSPNGVTDQNPNNNNTNLIINKLLGYETATINLELLTDNWGEETTWVFADENSNVIAQGGPYSDNQTINESFTVNPNLCYNFTLFDSESDGICCSYGIGSYTLTTDDDTEIFSGGDFGADETTQISIKENLSLSQFSDQNFKIYPNPTSSQIHIDSKINMLSFSLFDINGKQILKTQKRNIDLSSLSNGIYFLNITNLESDQFVTKKIIKE